MTLPLDIDSARTTRAAQDGPAGPRGEARPPAGPVLASRRGMSPEDRDWCFAMYELFGRGGDDEQLYTTVIPGDPWSKSRPRFARSTGRSYQHRDDREAEARLRAHLSVRGHMFPGNVMVVCRFYRSDMMRIDADNLLKHVCDSATGILWADDSQVTLVLGEMHLDRDNPRTVLLVGRHASTLTRGADNVLICTVCATAFKRPPGGHPRQTCSRACTQAAKGQPDLSVPVPCPQCQELFRRTTSRQVHCGRECANRARAGRAKPSTRKRSRCTQCGTQLDHGRGGRCRNCWRANPKGQPAPVQVELIVGSEA